MLRYSVRLGRDDIEQNVMGWQEKYLSPDLSFVSGVTSQDYHIGKYNVLPVSSSLGGSDIVRVDSSNVTRSGYVVIKGKTYDVHSGSTTVYTMGVNGQRVDYQYVIINGRYFYLNDGAFHIDRWLTEKFTTDKRGRVKNSVEEGSVDVPYDGNGHVSIDTIAWIEDGMVRIDGNDYFFDKDEQPTPSTKGGLRYYEDGQCLETSAITNCESIVYKPFEKENEYLNVTKFTLTKQNDVVGEKFDSVSFCKRFNYVMYNNFYYQIECVLDLDNEMNTRFVCRIPRHIISPEKYNSSDGMESFDVYCSVGEGGEDYVATVGNLVAHGIYGVKGLDDLYKITSFINMHGVMLPVSHDILNANEGSELIVYLDGSGNVLSVGDTIVFTDTFHKYVFYDIYEDDDRFVIVDGTKCPLVSNLCDKVLIDGNEHDVEYADGKAIGSNCLVTIGNEQVPMKIVSEDKVERYGTVVVSADGKPVTATYEIVQHDGVVIDGVKCIAGDGYVTSSTPVRMPFVVDEVIGSSTVVCSPYASGYEFTEAVLETYGVSLCKYAADNQQWLSCVARNKIFGNREITDTLAFQTTMKPSSSSDYYDLFSNFDIYVGGGFIKIPLMLPHSEGNNLMQGDVVSSQFVEVEKRKAINPIIDMEKDVYAPKYIDGDGRYVGSGTVFKPVEEIRVNLHFRTRDLLSWKVNEGYNDPSVSGHSDNWFVTDYHPYSDILKSSDASAKKSLMGASDLLGLMYFTNDDVYYQKKKISKSFLRFSYYDSTNPQTQNLLASSTVFMDGHKLFKTFIDNSRKNVNDYGEVGPYNTKSGTTLNKVSVSTEYLGRRGTNKGNYGSFRGTIIDDLHRLGSGFVISNKYETETSSEGFYLYMFKEYSEKLRPKPVYMKVEFNHAGVGRTIPFMMPMKWRADGTVKVPERPLSITSAEDLAEMKAGINLSDVYAQSYIPLYAVYDFVNKEYAYVFDDRYVSIEKSDDYERAVLNLFELKITNEEVTDAKKLEEEQSDVTYRRQRISRINVNDKFSIK